MTGRALGRLHPPRPGPFAADEASLDDVDLKYGDIMTLDALEGLVGAHAR